MPEIDEKLARYLAARWDAEAVRVTATVGSMRPREQKLVREAAIMGFVRGAMAGRVAGQEGVKPEIPDGREILAEVVSACLSMPDLYPAFDRMERLAQRRVRSQANGGEAAREAPPNALNDLDDMAGPVPNGGADEPG
jgi:hypothetical protein